MIKDRAILVYDEQFKVIMALRFLFKLKLFLPFSFAGF